MDQKAYLKFIGQFYQSHIDTQKVRIKIVDRFNQANTSHLKQIIEVFPPVGEFLHDRQHQPKIARDIDRL